MAHVSPACYNSPRPLTLGPRPATVRVYRRHADPHLCLRAAGSFAGRKPMQPPGGFSSLDLFGGGGGGASSVSYSKPPAAYGSNSYSSGYGVRQAGTLEGTTHACLQAVSQTHCYLELPDRTGHTTTLGFCSSCGPCMGHVQPPAHPHPPGICNSSSSG